MPEHQPFAAWRRPAVLALADLQIGAAYPDGEGLDQQLALLGGWLGQVVEAGRLRLQRDDGDCLHAHSFRSRTTSSLRFSNRR
jgi:hypothetical protein